MRSCYFINTPIEELERFDPETILAPFLDNFSKMCAQNAIEFMGMQVLDEQFTKDTQALTPLIDHLSTYASGYLKNQVIKERNVMKGYRYLDYVYSNKKVTHWLGWGLIRQDEINYAAVIFHLNDTIAGAHFLEQLEKITTNSPIWNINSQGSALANESAQWIYKQIAPKGLNSSSNWNRNYSAQHAQIDNEKQYWCAKTKDDKQWISFDLENPVELSKIRIQGAPHGRFFIRTFDLLYSVDKKNWTTLSLQTGLNNGTETKDIELGTTIITQYLKIIPKDFEGHPGLRIDFWASPVQAKQLEVQALFELSQFTDTAVLQDQLIACLDEMKTLNGIGF
jgi:phage-related protein